MCQGIKQKEKISSAINADPDIFLQSIKIEKHAVIVDLLNLFLKNNSTKG